MFGYRELPVRYRFVALPILLAALLMTLQSYLRFTFTGTIVVDAVLPDDAQSSLLFVLFAGALLMAGLGWFNAVAHAERYGLSEKETTAIALAAAAIGAVSLPYLSNDVFLYLACGDLARLGFNPYTEWGMLGSSLLEGHVSPLWKDQPFCKYGPLSTALFHLSATAAPLGVMGMLALYKLLVFAATAGFIYAARAFTRTMDRDGGLDPFSFIVLSPLVWLQGAGQGHNDIFAALLLVLGAIMLKRDAPWRATLFFAAAFAVKVYAAAAFLLIIVHFYRRSGVTPRLLAPLAGHALTALSVQILLYLPYWNGTDTLTVPYGALAAELPLNNTVFLAGFLYSKIFPSSPLPHREVYILLRNAFLPFIALLLLYQVRTMFRATERMLSVFGRVLVILICFYAARFHPWYFLVALPFLAERLDRRWMLWSIAVMTAANLLDIHNFMNRDSIVLIVALPAAVVFLNIMFFSRFRTRYFTS